MYKGTRYTLDDCAEDMAIARENLRKAQKNPIRKLLEEMWSDWELSLAYNLEEEENWTPIYRHLARTFLLVGCAIGILMGCGWGYLLYPVLHH
jgi:hypothetical protein